MKKKGGVRPNSGRKGYGQEEALKIRTPFVWAVVDHYLKSKDPGDKQGKIKITNKILDKILPNRNTVEGDKDNPIGFELIIKDLRDGKVTTNNN